MTASAQPPVNLAAWLDHLELFQGEHGLQIVTARGVPLVLHGDSGAVVPALIRAGREALQEGGARG